MKKIAICFVLVFCCVFLLVVVCNIAAYTKISMGCHAIREGDTTKAVRIIESTRNVNRYSAPLWLRGLYNSAEQDIDLLLVVACREGNIKLVELLLDKGADPNRYLDNSWSAIEATFVEGNEGRSLIAQMLIDNGADVDLHGGRSTALFNELSTLIYTAPLSQDQYNEIHTGVSLLVKSGASLVDTNGNTALHYAAFSNDTTLTKEVLDEGRVFLNAHNKRGETPLIWAVKAEAEHTVRFLLENGADPLLQDEAKKTALSYAEETGNLGIISLLTQAQGGI